MARYTGAVCRQCRREKQKLFLKGDRCYTEKCALERREFAPGQPGNARNKKLSEYVSGLTANPMNQGYASLTPLFTIADFLWNNAGYDGEQSITAAAHLLEPACGDAYKAFVDLQRASAINNNHSEFTVTDELRRYRKGESSAADIASN